MTTTTKVGAWLVFFGIGHTLWGNYSGVSFLQMAGAVNLILGGAILLIELIYDWLKGKR